mmetsp:Transcript_19861/g.37378  ORF Transcript_19861/g.37378 Transcript_19861/m.37378 type:complete len:260 (+) Transcript_19861:722-1501(+)
MRVELPVHITCGRDLLRWGSQLLPRVVENREGPVLVEVELVTIQRVDMRIAEDTGLWPAGSDLPNCNLTARLDDHFAHALRIQGDVDAGGLGTRWRSLHLSQEAIVSEKLDDDTLRGDLQINAHDGLHLPELEAEGVLLPACHHFLGLVVVQNEQRLVGPALVERRPQRMDAAVQHRGWAGALLRLRGDRHAADRIRRQLVSLSVAVKGKGGRAGLPASVLRLVIIPGTPGSLVGFATVLLALWPPFRLQQAGLVLARC